jgi:general nucleoside transport system permease protein
MIEAILVPSVFASAIRLATPYLLAGIGEMFGQRSGVLNLGVDGVMLMGAFVAHYTALMTGNLLLAVALAILTGAVMGLAMAFISVTLKAEQGISGIGIYLFGLGLSDVLFQKLVGTPRSVEGFSQIRIPILGDIQFLGIGEIFFNHNLLVYIAFLLVPLAAFVLNRTPFGLMIRAVGQNPEAADAMGINVARVRYITVTLGGAMSGLAGASLSIALGKVFQQNLTSGLGFIAVALVYFGHWRPYGVLAGAMLFSFVTAVQIQFGAVGIQIPAEFAKMAPYAITIIALIFASKQTEKPTALTKPFERGE